MELIAGIMLDVFFFARFIYIKTQFYKTKGIANGNANQYSSEFIYGNKGHNTWTKDKERFITRWTGGERYFGIVANMDFILVSTYEENGINPELVLYKKR